MILNWNFQRGGGEVLLSKIPSMDQVNAIGYFLELDVAK